MIWLPAPSMSNVKCHGISMLNVKCHGISMSNADVKCQMSNVKCDMYQWQMSYQCQMSNVMELHCMSNVKFQMYFNSRISRSCEMRSW